MAKKEIGAYDYEGALAAIRTVEHWCRRHSAEMHGNDDLTEDEAKGIGWPPCGSNGCRRDVILMLRLRRAGDYIKTLLHNVSTKRRPAMNAWEQADTPPTPATGWQGIESAPADGTWILVHGTGWVGLHPVEVSRWSNGAECWQTLDDGLCGVTHWMPLPTPPAGQDDPGAQG